MIISFSFLYSLAFPLFLSSLSSFVFLPSLPLFFFSFNYFYSFLFSFTFFSCSVFRIHYFCLLLSLFFTLFLSITLFSFPSRCYSIFLSPSLFSPLTLFLSSISVSFLSLYMLCATLHDRASIVGLFGFRFRRVARFFFTATYIAKDDAFYSRGPPLRSFCGHTSLKLNSPSSPYVLTLYDSCDTNSLGFFKEWLIYQTSFLDRDVENKCGHAASQSD